jgi:hypothetical protein
MEREQLQAVPDQIETLITEKRFTRAVDILSEAIRILNQPEFKNMGALHDVLAYLKNQEAVLTIANMLIPSRCMIYWWRSYIITSI